MVARQIDIQARKDKVLSITISQYIDTITPVSSKYIAQEAYLDVSSATIRNILAELETDGYLTHPHTSAGRIPTQLGYRYYVDHLMKDIHLLEEEKQRIKEEYHRESLELDRLLDKTSQVISDVTSYTSIISIDGCDDKLFCNGMSLVVNYPDYQDIAKIKQILEALEEKEQFLEVINRSLSKKIEVFIGHELCCSDIEGCSLAVSKYKTRKGPTGRIAILGPTRMNYQRVMSTLEYMSQLMEEVF